MSKEAMKLALAALEGVWKGGFSYPPQQHISKAITALREALAEQLAQQEPVAWRVKVETTFRDGSVNIGYQVRNEKMSRHDEPLYTSPPAQRTWVGLTDNEIALTHADYPHPQGFARAIEAKLKEKNT